MKFHSSVIFVSDIERSRDFYKTLMNQEIEHDFGKTVIFKGGLSIWEIRTGHVIPEHLDTGGHSNRFELYFEDADVEGRQHVLREAGIAFLHEVHKEAWGQRTIRFFDPDGHLIEIGEPLEVFVRNLRRSGLSPQAITEKSGVALETVRQILAAG